MSEVRLVGEQTFDIRITLRIPAQAEGMIRVTLKSAIAARWTLSRSGRLVLDHDGEGEQKPFPVHTLDLGEHDLYLRWGKSDTDRRIKLDCGVATSGSEVRVEIVKDARISVYVASGERQQGPHGGDIGFVTHDNVQSPLEQSPSGPPQIGMLSLVDMLSLAGK
jgi:hypothetical protein